MATLHFALDRSDGYLLARVRTPPPPGGVAREQVRRLRLTPAGLARLRGDGIRAEGATVPGEVVEALMLRREAIDAGKPGGRVLPPSIPLGLRLPRREPRRRCA